MIQLIISLNGCMMIFAQSIQKVKVLPIYVMCYILIRFIVMVQ